MEENLVPTTELISLAKKQGLYLGSKTAESYIRYLTKLGLLPSPKRKALKGSYKTVGHYPVSCLQILREIDIKIGRGWSLQQIVRESDPSNEESVEKIPSPSKFMPSLAHISNKTQGILLVGSSLVIIVLSTLSQHGLPNNQTFGLNDLSSILSPTQQVTSTSKPSDNQSVNLVILNYDKTSLGSIAGATLTTTGNTSDGSISIPVSVDGSRAWVVNQGTSLSDLVTTGQVKANGNLAYSGFGQSNTGLNTIPAGSRKMTVFSSAVGVSSKIFVTFVGDYAPATRFWIKDSIPGTSFTLELDIAPITDTAFNWWIVN